MHEIHGYEEYRLSLPARIVLPLPIPNLWKSVNWPHIHYAKCYSKKVFRIKTLSWSVRSMGLRPEWSWRARSKRISCPDGSVQYWNFLLLPPPPAIFLFHISSDQCWECSNLFRRSSSVSQNSIAPSSSPCWRMFILFATGYAWSNWAPGSKSIHSLSRIV